MATSEKAVMVVGVVESEQSIYVLEWALDHFFAPHTPNFHFDLIIVRAKPSPISVVGIGGPGSGQALPYVDADLKKIAARVIEQAKELCISKSETITYAMSYINWDNQPQPQRKKPYHIGEEMRSSTNKNNPC